MCVCVCVNIIMMHILSNVNKLGFIREYSHIPTDRIVPIVHTTAFVTQVVKHWLERDRSV